MLYQPHEIKDIVLKNLPDALVEVTDLTGTRDHYQVKVVSKAFEGKSPLERHRLVYSFFGADVGGKIHALTIQTLTP